MRQHLIPSALVVLAMAVIIGRASPPRVSAHRALQASDLATICPELDTQDESIDPPEYLSALTDGPEFTAFAAGTAGEQDLPAGTEFALGLVRVSLPQEVSSKNHRTNGPLLILVEQGEMDVVIGGDPVPLDAGESVLIQIRELFSVENTGDGAATALLFGIVPPDDQIPIGSTGGVFVWRPAPEELDLVDSETLFYGEVGSLARQETTLFLACLRWPELDGPSPEDAAFSGPTALVVTAGEVATSETYAVGAAGCGLFPARHPVALMPDEAPSVALFFGALEADAPTENPDEGSTLIDCAGPSGDAPDDE